MASDLTRFNLADMLRCSNEVRRRTRTTTSMEDAAHNVCDFFYHELTGANGERACALVRCYKTHRFEMLPGDLQEFARNVPGAGHAVRPETNCLTLLASVGEKPAWNSRKQSRGHRAIPLVSNEMVERAPMIAQLIRAFGLELSAVVHPTHDVVRDLAGKTYGVFHVEEALGSPYIPAQEEFVIPHKIKSVLGFGGALPSGQLFAVIVFSHVHVSADAADRFRNIALDVKTGIFALDETQVFA